MDEKTLKSLRLVFFAAWAQTLQAAKEAKDSYAIGWKYGFARALIVARDVLGEKSGVPVFEALEEMRQV